MKKKLFLTLTFIRNISLTGSVKSFNKKLEPWYVTGLVDGDGMFGCIISKTNKTISLEFKITALSSTSYELINELKTFFKPQGGVEEFL